jgi:hypothetical protein
MDALPVCGACMYPDTVPLSVMSMVPPQRFVLAVLRVALAVKAVSLALAMEKQKSQDDELEQDEEVQELVAKLASR